MENETKLTENVPAPSYQEMTQKISQETSPGFESVKTIRMNTNIDLGSNSIESRSISTATDEGLTANTAYTNVAGLNPGGTELPSDTLS